MRWQFGCWARTRWLYPIINLNWPCIKDSHYFCCFYVVYKWNWFVTEGWGALPDWVSKGACVAAVFTPIYCTFDWLIVKDKGCFSCWITVFLCLIMFQFIQKMPCPFLGRLPLADDGNRTLGLHNTNVAICFFQDNGCRNFHQSLLLFVSFWRVVRVFCWLFEL